MLLYLIFSICMLAAFIAAAWVSCKAASEGRSGKAFTCALGAGLAAMMWMCIPPGSF